MTRPAVIRAFGMLAVQLDCNAVESLHRSPSPLVVSPPASVDERNRESIDEKAIPQILSAVTLEEMLAAYIAAHPQHDRYTRKHYRQTKRRLLELGGPWMIEKIGVPEAQLLYDEAQRRWSTSCANQLRKCLRAAWNYATQRGRAPMLNPWKLVRTLPEGRRNLHFDRGWLPGVMAIVAEAGETGLIDLHAGRFLGIDLSSGARPWKDLLCLRTKDVDVAGEAIIFRSKMGRIRSIPMQVLEPRARAALLAQLEIAGTNEFVWPALRGRGPKMGQKTIIAAWRTVLPLIAAAGLRTTTLDGDDLTLYDAARHGLCSYAIGELGLPREQVAKILGHADIQTLLKHYLHVSVAHAVQTAKAIAQSIVEFGGGRDLGSGQWGVRPDRIRTAREQVGLTQAQLAEKLGVTTAAVSQWETGAAKVNTTALDKIAHVTKLDHGFFFGRGGAA